MYHSQTGEIVVGVPSPMRTVARGSPGLQLFPSEHNLAMKLTAQTTFLSTSMMGTRRSLTRLNGSATSKSGDYNQGKSADGSVVHIAAVSVSHT
ncbi:hypothetical protein J3459_016524 [Metarhizium acridum]|nr:hypothetical protein J3459_016524 [Metarhizium acridum]